MHLKCLKLKATDSKKMKEIKKINMYLERKMIKEEIIKNMVLVCAHLYVCADFLHA